MRTSGSLVMLKGVGFLAMFAACSSLQRAENSVALGVAPIRDVNGALVGTAQLSQDANGVVRVDVASLALPAGTHGVHFHQVGKCEGGTTAFSTAGGHFNPSSKEHGLSNPNGPHAGDAPNAVIPASGIGAVSFTTNRVTLTPGPTSLFDADGSAIVVHAGADDQVSQPSGNSGARIACGVVQSVAR
jgi:Cu-Zn family superoxide dismutase